MKTPEEWADHIAELMTPETRHSEIVHAIETSVSERNGELMAVLEEAIEMCPCCGGSGEMRAIGDETEIGCSPGSSAVSCHQCEDWRAALAKSKGAGK